MFIRNLICWNILLVDRIWNPWPRQG